MAFVYQDQLSPLFRISRLCTHFRCALLATDVRSWRVLPVEDPDQQAIRGLLIRILGQTDKRTDGRTDEQNSDMYVHTSDPEVVVPGQVVTV